ncbi:MAG: flagellar protein [Lachnospiraceae bacterium]|nr:flagellar protein [Lachnospiraceae bacterium]
MRVLNVNSQYPSIEETASKYLSDAGSKAKTEVTEEGKSFAGILKEKREAGTLSEQGLKFSKHASVRLNDRNIELSNDQLFRLQAGMQKANQKGINETLVIMDQLAFIVNAKNNTVITAMDQTEADENVFTNIDGAVIV